MDPLESELGRQGPWWRQHAVNEGPISHFCAFYTFCTFCTSWGVMAILFESPVPRMFSYISAQCRYNSTFSTFLTFLTSHNILGKSSRVLVSVLLSKVYGKKKWASVWLWCFKNRRHIVLQDLVSETGGGLSSLWLTAVFFSREVKRARRRRCVCSHARDGTCSRWNDVQVAKGRKGEKSVETSAPPQCHIDISQKLKPNIEASMNN
jgi:hypothetical protein